MNKRVFVPFPLATVVQDYFGRPNENPIRGPWVKHPSGGVNRRLDSFGAYGAAGDGSSDVALAYTAGGKMRDQWAECHYATTTAVMDGGPCVRINMNANGSSNYVMFTGYGSGNLYQSVADGLTQLGTNLGMTVVIGDTVRLEAIGNTIHVYHNGRYRGSRTVTDATAQRAITVGYPGLFIYDEGLRLDRFRGGSLPYGPTPLPIRKAETRRAKIFRILANENILGIDDFNRPDGSIGSNWTSYSGTWNIYGNEVGLTTNQVAAIRFTKIQQWPVDQWSEVTIGSIVSTNNDEGVGPAVRINSSSGNLYFVQANSIQTRVYKRVGGVYTKFGGTGTAQGSPGDGPPVKKGDVLKLVVKGSSIALYCNNVLFMGPYSDTSIKSGDVGMWDSRQYTLAKITSWRGGYVTDEIVPPILILREPSSKNWKPLRDPNI